MNPTNLLSLTFRNPWHTPEVAKAQRQLVETQLADEIKCAPFQAFLRAMREIFHAAPELETGVFLDVGCGVGHYGVLCNRHYPRLNYFGSDASAAMVAEADAWQPDLHVIETPFEDNAFEAFPIVLVSQVMEMLDDPIAALELVLAKMREGSYLILHRLRWTKEASRAVYEKTYLGLDARNFVWNDQAVLRLCMAMGNVKYLDVWDSGSATLVVEIGAGEPAC